MSLLGVPPSSEISSPGCKGGTFSWGSHLATSQQSQVYPIYTNTVPAFPVQEGIFLGKQTVSVTHCCETSTTTGYYPSRFWVCLGSAGQFCSLCCPTGRNIPGHSQDGQVVLAASRGPPAAAEDRRKWSASPLRVACGVAGPRGSPRNTARGGRPFQPSPGGREVPLLPLSGAHSENQGQPPSFRGKGGQRGRI